MTNETLEGLNALLEQDLDELLAAEPDERKRIYRIRSLKRIV